MTTQDTQNRHNGTSVAAPDVELRTVVPAADMFETPDAFVVRLDMPGATRETISVKVDHEDLVIRGRVEARQAGDGTPVYREMEPAQYARVFPIGKGVNTGAVDARFEEGVLTITLAKRDEVKPRDIQVQGG
jgi:HSP20 family protein